MPRPSRQLPRAGQNVWHEEKGEHPNGIIKKVFWEQGEPDEVLVRFSDGTFDTLDYTVLEGKWTDKFGGTWYLKKEG